MGLQTTMTTSLTGLRAAETSIDVTGNNVANANTVGFKQSSVSFATQFLQTQSIGSGPTDSRGGTNPRQVGLGVKVAEITPDFTQGTVEISSNPLDLAIQGDGFFIVQGPQGEQFYTRNGQFKTNANNEIVTITGHRVLGFSADLSTFQLNTGSLSPITIPLGSAAVAQATRNVTMEGNLNPNDSVGTTPEVISTGVLSDREYEFPTSVPARSAITLPSVVSTAGVATGTTSPVIPQGTYRYRFAFADPTAPTIAQEGPPSAATADITVPLGGSDQIDLTGLPTTSDPAFTQLRIYRDSGSGYQLVDTIAEGTTTYADTVATGGATLQEGGLESNSYSYYITYYHSGSNEESRPSAQFGPVTADEFNSPRIRLEGFPDPATIDFDRVRIYRNTRSDPGSFYLVDTIDPTVSNAYIDSKADADIASPSNLLNLEGPAISSSTLLTDVISRDGANYNRLFSGPGDISFTGSKNGRELGEQTLRVDAGTTVQDLLSFMQQSLGIVTTANEDTFPSVPSGYGGRVDGGRLVITSNMGQENAVAVDLGAFVFTPDSTGEAEAVPLEFDQLQEATTGEGTTAEVTVYDSLGSTVQVRITTVLESSDASGAQFRWIATSPDHHPDGSFSTVVGTGVLRTDGSGKYVSSSDNRVSIDRGDSPAESPLTFDLDFSQITGLEAETQWNAGVQDGLAAGNLTSFIITESGLVQGVFSNGSSRDLGQIRMARFANNGGLEQIGDNLFTGGVNSGLPILGNPGSQGIGNITAGAVELSNTDIGQNLIELILASTQYRGGARVITAVQQLLDELLNLRR
jgi:flagellar hook protein FlgE